MCRVLSLLLLALVAVVCGIATVKPVAADARRSGTIFFASGQRGTDIFRMRPDGTRRTRLTHHMPGKYGPGEDIGPAAAPDGDRIAFLRRVRTRDGSGLVPFVMRRDGTQLRRVRHALPDGGGCFCPSLVRWTLDNSLTYNFGASTAVHFVTLQGARRQIPISPMESGVEFVSDVHNASYSPDGSKLVVAGHERAADRNYLYEVATDGAQRRLTSRPLQWLTSPRYSPDGSQIAFGCSEDDGGGAASICITDAHGTYLRVLLHYVGTTEGEVAGLTLAWSPNGRRLVYDCGRRFTSICVANRDGSHRHRLGSGRTPDWSR